MLVIPVNRVVDKKRIIGKNRGPRRKRGTRVTDPSKISTSFLIRTLRFRFYSTRDPKFALCMIPKVASTSLSTFLVNAHQSGNKKNYGSSTESMLFIFFHRDQWPVLKSTELWRMQ
jgi:hypothetical protein